MQQQIKSDTQTNAHTHCCTHVNLTGNWNNGDMAGHSGTKRPMFAHPGRGIAYENKYETHIKVRQNQEEHEQTKICRVKRAPQKLFMVQEQAENCLRISNC